MHKSLLILGLCACALPTTVLVGCGKEVHAKASFHAVAVTAGPGPIGRNEDLVIRFSRHLASGSLPRRALTVRDARGRAIPVTLERDGRHLVIRPPRSPLEGDVPLWPRTQHLELQVPIPLAGPTFRSIDGDDLAGGFAARVYVHDGWRRQPGNLELIESVPANGAVNVPMDASIGLMFNAPVDVNSLVSGIQMIDRKRGVVVDVVPMLDKKDPRHVVIHPFATLERRDKGRSLLDAGAEYEVVVTRSLRSRDGRRPIERTRVKFTNEETGPRYLRVSFTEQSDFADESRGAFDPTRLSIRPKMRRDYVTSRGDGTSQLTTFAAENQKRLKSSPADPPIPPRELPHVFSRCPSRTQILVPAIWLGSDPQFVTGLVFQLQDAFQNRVRATGLAVSLGYLNPERPDTTPGLSGDLDLNVIGGQLMDLGSQGDDHVILRPVPRQAVVQLGFERPFFYAGGGRDLVIDIRNGGVDQIDKTGRPYEFQGDDWPGLDVMGAQHSAAGHGLRTLAFAGAKSNPFPTDFVLRYMLQVARTPPVMTRWYQIDDVEKPSFLPRPLTYGTGDDGDYTLQYQAGEPVEIDGQVQTLEDGTPKCRATGLWVSHPPVGCRTLRVRISFANRWYPSGEQPPEIEYILVRYKGS